MAKGGKKGPGKAHRKGLSMVEVAKMFPDDAAAERWFIEARWPDGVACPKCGSLNIQERPTRKPQPYRCRDCRKDFSLKTGTVMENSKKGYQVWAFAIYLMNTNLKGVASMKLHRDLHVTQRTAWHLAHRIREVWQDGSGGEQPFAGPVEVDETYLGGRERNKHARKKLRLGRGPVGKTAVVGVKDRTTKRVSAVVVSATDSATLQGFVASRVSPGAKVYTDDATAYSGYPNRESVRHSVGEYVRGQAHTNGVESFWSMLKRGYQGTYHKMSPKHLNRYVCEFAGRHNVREYDTLDQMRTVASAMFGKRLRYRDLIQATGASAETT